MLKIVGYAPGAFAWYDETTCPLESKRSTLYGFPSTHGVVPMTIDKATSASPGSNDVEVIVKTALFTFACAITTDLVPVFFNVRSIMLSFTAEPPLNCTFVIVTDVDPMKPTVIPPIQAATATLTATVTAIKIIDATTGLKARAFFHNFLKDLFIF